MIMPEAERGKRRRRRVVRQYARVRIRNKQSKRSARVSSFRVCLFQRTADVSTTTLHCRTYCDVRLR